jgi:dTDP-4-dehydrorhamnose 3,5-epimerase
MSSQQLKKDTQTVTQKGDSIQKLIDGVVIRPAVTNLDPRGELTEVFDFSWGVSSAPIPFVYHVVARPGSIRAWLVHRIQTDRLYLAHGTFHIALYDDRPESPTHKMVNTFTFGTNKRALLIIPPGIYHGVANVGKEDAYFVNMPTHPYNHENPDKYRLPLDNDLIPYKFPK